MQINDARFLVTLVIAFLIQFPLTMAPRCRRNVGLFYRQFSPVYDNDINNDNDNENDNENENDDNDNNNGNENENKNENDDKYM